MSLSSPTASEGRPRAGGGACGTGVIRQVPQDFQVEEFLPFEPSGAGEHCWIRLRKTGANSGWAAEQLARVFGARPRDVGMAGSKDRHAVATQWFSVPGQPPAGLAPGVELAPGLEVIDMTRHDRKLRRGWLAGNGFRLRVRRLVADEQALAERLEALAEQGMPNYFGDQRFGRGGSNLTRAREWFATGRAPRQRGARSFALSAARALLFNQVLARRVEAESWRTLRVGDVARLAGSNSQFVVTELGDELAARASAGDLSPSGPLWGSGDLLTAGSVRALEEAVAAEETELVGGLAERTKIDRRPLRVLPAALRWSIDADGLSLSFRLPPGSYATALLEEMLVIEDGASIP